MPGAFGGTAGPLARSNASNRSAVRDMQYLMRSARDPLTADRAIAMIKGRYGSMSDFASEYSQETGGDAQSVLGSIANATGQEMQEGDMPEEAPPPAWTDSDPEAIDRYRDDLPPVINWGGQTFVRPAAFGIPQGGAFGTPDSSPPDAQNAAPDSVTTETSPTGTVTDTLTAAAETPTREYARGPSMFAPPEPPPETQPVPDTTAAPENAAPAPETSPLDRPPPPAPPVTAKTTAPPRPVATETPADRRARLRDEDDRSDDLFGGSPLWTILGGIGLGLARGEGLKGVGKGMEYALTAQQRGREIRRKEKADERRDIAAQDRLDRQEAMTTLREDRRDQRSELDRAGREKIALIRDDQQRAAAEQRHKDLLLKFDQQTQMQLRAFQQQNTLQNQRFGQQTDLQDRREKMQYGTQALSALRAGDVDGFVQLSEMAGHPVSPERAEKLMKSAEFGQIVKQSADLTRAGYDGPLYSSLRAEGKNHQEAMDATRERGSLKDWKHEVKTIGDDDVEFAYNPRNPSERIEINRAPHRKTGNEPETWTREPDPDRPGKYILRSNRGNRKDDPSNEKPGTGTEREDAFMVAHRDEIANGTASKEIRDKYRAIYNRGQRTIFRSNKDTGTEDRIIENKWDGFPHPDEGMTSTATSSTAATSTASGAATTPPGTTVNPPGTTITKAGTATKTSVPVNEWHPPKTGEQGKAVQFALRFEQGENTLTELTRKGYDPTKYLSAGKIEAALRYPRMATGFMDADTQRFVQAARNILTTYLRKDSGAAITKEEWAQYGPMLIPLPGESPQAVADKRKLRENFLSGVIAESSGSYDYTKQQIAKQNINSLSLDDLENAVKRKWLTESEASAELKRRGF